MKVLSFIFILIWTISCHADTPYINEIPDFTQTDIKGEGAGNGQQYCGPVSVSNSIIWLNDNSGNQSKLIHTLASGPYMNTSLKDGTGTSGLLRGVDKIAIELFGGYQTLEYEGWRKHPKRYSAGVKVPCDERIKSAITKKSAAWINIGWYTYNQSLDEYRRIGGHWVTLAGYKNGQLIIHDPAPRAGQSFSNEFVEYSLLTSGTLVGKKWGLPCSARGFISLNKGMHKKEGADVAIIDGVVYIVI